jgi:hypothetical protein
VRPLRIADSSALIVAPAVVTLCAPEPCPAAVAVVREAEPPVAPSPPPTFPPSRLPRPVTPAEPLLWLGQDSHAHEGPAQ